MHLPPIGQKAKAPPKTSTLQVREQVRLETQCWIQGLQTFGLLYLQEQMASMAGRRAQVQGTLMLHACLAKRW